MDILLVHIFLVDIGVYKWLLVDILLVDIGGYQWLLYY
jgi:hypothetical protein